MALLAPLPYRRLLVLLGLLVILCVPCRMVLDLRSRPDTAQEQALASRLEELQVRLQHLDALHRARREEVAVLAAQLSTLLELAGREGGGATAVPGVNSTGSPGGAKANRTRLPLRDITGLGLGRRLPSLRLPSVYDFLPHLLDSSSSLRPAYCLSRGRTGVSVVLGIPTVKREVQSYLMATLRNLTGSMSPEERADTLIVVFIAETDQEYVLQVSKQLQEQFTEHVASGLIEVVSPPAAYYPYMQSLRPTLGDTPERVRWRSKQNLDFAFLMMYSQPKGTFYVQLEDDILAKMNFVSTMKNYALQKISEKLPWFMLEFCQLGFIGKMFKCDELTWLIQFFLMFYNDQPVDWLLYHLTSTKICNLDTEGNNCNKSTAQLLLQYKPSLFQHVGIHSSLKGKVQTLTDDQFGKVTLFFPHKNPQASVESAIKHYEQYSLPKAYAGESFFWGLPPQKGDHLVFKFTNPIPLKCYLFRSGNAEHPTDIFYNTTVEVLPFSSQMNCSKNDFNSTSDGFIIIGQFNSRGIAEGTIDSIFGSIKVLRLSIHSDNEKWVILSEIHIVAANGSCSCCSPEVSH